MALSPNGSRHSYFQQAIVASRRKTLLDEASPSWRATEARVALADPVESRNARIAESGVRSAFFSRRRFCASLRVVLRFKLASSRPGG